MGVHIGISAIFYTQRSNHFATTVVKLYSFRNLSKVLLIVKNKNHTHNDQTITY